MTVRNPLVWIGAGYLSEIPAADQIQFGIGSVGAPGITFRGANTTGLYYVATSVRVSIAGVQVANFSATGLAIAGSIAATSVSATTSIAAGTVVDAGTLFSIGGTTVINANRLVLLRNYAVASLPAAAPDGAMAFATDSTQTLTAGIGTPVVGGSTNKVPVYSDGGVWIIG